MLQEALIVNFKTVALLHPGNMGVTIDQVRAVLDHAAMEVGIPLEREASARR